MMEFASNASTSRRNAFKIGGLTVTLAALAAACGEGIGGDNAPGRVGNAPVVTTPPDFVVDEAVFLRTASSLEYTIIDAYERLLSIDGAVAAEDQPLVQRLIANHQVIADEMVALTEASGGEPWTCANPWLTERLIDPTIEMILSNTIGIVLEDTTTVQVMGEVLPMTDAISTSLGEISMVTTEVSDLPEGDEVEFTRLDGAVSEDLWSFAAAIESLAAASHQELASASVTPEGLLAHVEAAALEARHASVVAITIDGAAAYISPALLGQDVPPTELGQIRQFAVGSTFAQTAPIEVKAGPPNLNNVRTSATLQTPSDNTFIYNELSGCDA
ncbi:MAG: hypothetical protein ACI8V4_002106 [Ilumatobacter sp.]|jgi:hypothetical protein